MIKKQNALAKYYDRMKRAQDIKHEKELMIGIIYLKYPKIRKYGQASQQNLEKI